MAYRPQKTRNLYQPGQQKPFALSRSKVELFVQCPRCFYLDARLGIKRPPMFPFNLNSAVDELLKKEFDQYRSIQQPHPVMTEHQLNLIPYHHPQLDLWRHNFTGIQWYDKQLGLQLFGAVDDIWADPSDELYVVDYKATSRNVTDPNALVYPEYKRQLGFYAWLLEKNGFQVANIGYLLYCNGLRSAQTFEGRLDFEVYLLAVHTDTAWIAPTLTLLHDTLQQQAPPAPGADCDYCAYVKTRWSAEASTKR